MTIHLPKELESRILAAVHDGQFTSLDDAMTQAASLLLERKGQQPQEANGPTARAETPAQTHKPIWEVVDELRNSVPPEEFSKLPKDGAEQLDHYLYGSPKRPTA